MADTIQSVNVGESVQNFHLSMWDLFFGADWVVQIVLIVLMFASIWSWTIILAKLSRLRMLKRQSDKFEEAFWSGVSLNQLFESISKRTLTPMATVFSAAMKEWQHQPGRGLGKSSDRFSVQDRIQRVMSVTINREMDDLEKYMIFLGSVGSTAPFIGLFGTVWGVMDSFQSIAASQSTNLAVVAPGMAEALFATGIGLIAAVPAILAYNKLSTEINRFGNRLEAFAEEFMTVISRQAEEVA
jgi:biopolymer transport protein TolQ